ncbi:hypothetical protein V8F33_013793 [Rhypophila sp. PSN 637]
MEDNTTYPEFISFTAGIPPIPEDEFCVHGIIYANPTKSDALEKIYAETTRLAATEPGMLHYSVARDPDNRDAFHFYERYAGRAAFEAHNGQPIIVRLLNDEEKLVRGVRFKFVRAIRAAEVGMAAGEGEGEGNSGEGVSREGEGEGEDTGRT